MKIMFFLVLLFIAFLLSGCRISNINFDPYVKEKYGVMAIDSWYKDKNLGKLRKKAEGIDEIISKKCSYLENKKNKYIFSCTLTITKQGETIIPLSKHIKRKVYVVFIKENGNTYTSKVYNSKYKKTPWLYDKYLDY